MHHISTLSLVLLAATTAAQDDTPLPAAADHPIVNSKGDFLALSRPDKWRYSRANRPPVSFFIDSGGRWSSPADLDDTTGDVAVARLRAGGGLSLRISDTADLIIRGNAEFSFYEFDNAAGLIPSLPAVAEPFEDVYSLTFNPVFRVLPEHGWQWFIGGRIRSAGESDADFGDTIIGGGIAGASYDIADNFRLGLALNINTRLEGGVWVLPIPIIVWDITDDLTLRTVEDGIALEYWFANSWNLSLHAGFDRREYRLADDNPIHGGSFTDSRVPVSLALTYSPSDSTVITGRVGTEAWGSLEINNRSDNEIADIDLGANLLVGFDIRFAF